MGNIKYQLDKKDNNYNIKEVTKFSSNECEVVFDSLNELFKYLFDTDKHMSFYDIFRVLESNSISYNKCELINYYVSNSLYIQNSTDEIYIKVKINKGSIYEILSILPKDKSLQKKVKGASLTLKVSKQYIPFYMSIFIKDYTIEDYYLTLKNLFGDTRLLKFVDLYNHNGEYFVVKNRDKIVYISINKDMANCYVELISSIRKDASLYFVPNIELVCGFKNLINYLKIHNPNIHANSVKNLIDFNAINTESLSEDEKEYNYLIGEGSKNYIIKTKDNDYILKEDINSIYDFVIKNKINSPEIMEISEMKRVVSKREVFKSVFLANVMEDKNIEQLNGLSIFEGDNLIRIYSNLVSILLKNKELQPVLAVILENDTLKYDVLFFFEELSMKNYIEENKDFMTLLNVNYISLDNIKDKMIEKNLEILMTDYDSFHSEDIAINLTHLYVKNKNPYLKMKKLDDIQYIIDVDSSLDNDVASCGIVLRDSNNKILGKISRKLNAKTSVEAEIRGAMHAIKYAVIEDLKEICLRYDYVGIFEYLISEPATDIAKEYQEFFLDILNKSDIDIYFKKVKAHSSDEYNELADYLASNLNVNESFMKTN